MTVVTFSDSITFRTAHCLFVLSNACFKDDAFIRLNVYYISKFVCSDRYFVSCLPRKMAAARQKGQHVIRTSKSPENCIQQAITFFIPTLMLWMVNDITYFIMR